MTPRANAAAMLASGRRNADRFHGELFAVYVTQPNLTTEDRTALARNVMLARAQQAHVDILEGQRPDRRRFSTSRARTASRSSSSATTSAGRGARGSTGSLLDRLIRDAEGMDVRVFPH